MRRRDFLRLAGSGALGGANLLASSRAFAADLVPVGVIIPGSTSDRGWMQSGYTGMLKAEKDLADKIKIPIFKARALFLFGHCPQAETDLLFRFIHRKKSRARFGSRRGHLRWERLAG